MVTNIADRIMNWDWGRGNWDKNSPAHKYWKNIVKKHNHSLSWWRRHWEEVKEN